MNGAQLLCRTLEALGVECVFGLPGTQNVALYEALRGSALRSVVPTHELAGCFMANGYYRASGRPAALLTIPGPGFAYALAGLAEARQDSAALLHVVGAPPSGKQALQLQALDQRRIAEPLVKGIVRAERAADIPGAVARCLDLATGGEPGPVMFEYETAALEEDVEASEELRRAAPPALPAAATEQAIALLAAARRPLIMAGQGCASDADGLRALAELLPAPVFTTLAGRGVLPEDHALALGFDFAFGALPSLNELVRRSDCVLVLGCKLTAAGTDDFRLELPADRLLHVDASPEVLGATYAERLGVAAPVAAFFERALPALRASRAAAATEWTPAEVAGWRTRLRLKTADAGLEPVFHGVETGTAAAFFAALRRALPDDGIVVTDSGLHQTLARRYLEIRSPRGLIVPSDFQSMGFGLPGAIGAKLAAPARPVVAVIGDGGFAMSGLELLTAAREGVAVTLVVFNDGQLNRIRLQQIAQYGHSAGCEVRSPDFEVFAEALGVDYARAEGDVEAVLRTAIGRASPTLVEVVLGDSTGIRVERVKGLARTTVRRRLPPRAIRWLRERMRRR